jgi:hypothetical protein
MGRLFSEIDSTLSEWIAKQPMYFVASAPLCGDGHVNVSPKGGAGTFAVLGPRPVAYLDMTGSGIETISHIQENGRITIMVCAFEGAPRIIRIFGSARPVFPESTEWTEIRSHFSPSAEITNLLRAIVVVDVRKIRDSCGFVVPRMDLVAERDTLFRWAANKATSEGDGWDNRYRWLNNRESLDGLPGLAIDDIWATEDDHLNSKGRAL